MSEKQGVEIDYCPDCRGVWLDRGELEKIITRGIAEEQAWESRARGPAPAAQTRRERDYDERDYDERDHDERDNDERDYDERDNDERGHRSDDYRGGKHGGRGKRGRRGRKSWLESVFDVLD